ncbi:MAG: glycosyltransferase family 9 protein [Pseudobdellovibrionaceae bacterium]|nr:glycosyltransferase family 9 protein [Bdellovibrionales bacterium]USN48975.1 MAG: glycosyltransferase family 9 protein [Pseudobdellovibrionaceae bacterium]
MTQCRFFSGYKPCDRSENCDEKCPQLSVPKTRILVVHLEALGAVLRATSLLPAIHRKYPDAHVTWVTKGSAKPLLENNPFIDRILTIKEEDLLALSTLSFDVSYCIDKSLAAGGVLNKPKFIKERFGFGVDSKTGVILPETNAADELWQLGLSNEKKFFENNKPETQLMIEAFELGPFKRDEYVLSLTENEKHQMRERRQHWLNGKKLLVGINTGCSPTIPYKKFTEEGHQQLVRKMLSLDEVRVVLLGGGSETASNLRIAAGLDVITSPTEAGLRDGAISIAACDIVISGDSLGMHMGIALKKWVVAWFGPTCAHEIDLYGRGRRVLSQVSCSPCWKRACQKSVMCYDRVDFDHLVHAVEEGIQWLTSSYKQPISETSFSASL